MVCEAEPRAPGLPDRARAPPAARHYSRRTEGAFAAWIRRYIVFHDKRHPTDMGAPEITRFLSSLAVEGNVAASTQNQALSAVLFLYRDVLDLDVPWLDGIVRAKRPQRLPVVLTRDEVRAVLRRLEGAPRLMAYLLYGAGLRLLECCRLRVQDVDFASNQIVVRGGKGDKDRMTVLPAVIKPDLARHLESVREQYRRDVECGARVGRASDGARSEIPECAARVGVALGLSGDPHVRGAAHRPAAPTSSARIRPAARRQARRLARGHREAGGPAHAAPLIRHALARGGARHPDRPGAARAS